MLYVQIYSCDLFLRELHQIFPRKRSFFYIFFQRVTVPLLAPTLAPMSVVSVKLQVVLLQCATFVCLTMRLCLLLLCNSSGEHKQKESLARVLQNRYF